MAARSQGHAGARGALGVFAAALALLASGCGGGEEERASDFSGAVVRLGDVVAAEVNGSPIYISDIRREGAAQGLINANDALEPSSPVFEQLLAELIDQRLLALEAVRRGLHDTDEARRRLAASRERILGNVLVETVVDGAVTEASVLRMYEEQVKLVELGEEVRASHIVVESLDEANEIVTLLASGVSFRQLALDRSLDETTRSQGGDIGYVTPDMVTAPIAEAAFSTPVGRVAAPFQTEFGWHVLKVDDRRAEDEPTFDEMRPRIVSFMTFDEIQGLLEALRTDGDVRRLVGPGGSVTGDTPLRPDGAALPTEP